MNAIASADSAGNCHKGKPLNLPLGGMLLVSIAGGPLLGHRRVRLGNIHWRIARGPPVPPEVRFRVGWLTLQIFPKITKAARSKIQEMLFE